VWICCGLILEKFGENDIELWLCCDYTLIIWDNWIVIALRYVYGIVGTNISLFVYVYCYDIEIKIWVNALER